MSKKNTKIINRETNKSRNFEFVLYSDNAEHLKAFQLFDYVFEKWAYICHNNDIKEDGTPKKEHYHVVGVCPYPLKIGTIANKLQIEENLVNPCNSLDGMLRYFTHLDDTDKFQYNQKDIVCSPSMQYSLTRAYRGASYKFDDEEIYSRLFEYFEINFYRTVSFSDFAVYAKKNNFLSYALQRSYAFNLLINEHNMKICEKKS